MKLLKQPKIFINKLAAKFLLPISLLIILTALALSFYFIRYQKNISIDQEKIHTYSLARNLAYNAEYGVLTKNRPLLDNLVKGVISEHNIIFAKIADKENKVLAVSGKNKNPFYLCQYPVMTGKRNDSEEVLLFSAEKETEEEIIGTVYLSASLSDLYDRLKEMRNKAMGITLGVITIAIIFTFIIVGRITRPIKELVWATEEISRGDLHYLVAVKTGDEIGKLAAAFNAMTKNLQKTTVSKDYVDSIIESIADTLIVTDSGGTIKRVNQSALDLLGYTEAEMIGKPVSSYFVEDITGEVKWQTLMIGESLKDYEVSYRGKNNENIPVSFSASAIKDKTGNLTGFVIDARDIREIKRLQAQMLQAGKMASIGQLAGGVAHEINNPMGVILGFAQSVARMVKETDVFYMPLKSIEREAIRCRKLVGDLLTFSRVTKTEKENADLNTTIDGALSLIEAQAKIKHNVEIIRDYGTGLPPITMNKNQIQQIIVNLCNNAIDAMPQGGKITISTKLKDKGNNLVEIVVADTGEGMSKEVKQRIFEPFFTTKEVGKGTGLGLSLCYEIVKKHQGDIEVASEVGKGTAFTIQLPIIA